MSKTGQIDWRRSPQGPTRCRGDREDQARRRPECLNPTGMANMPPLTMRLAIPVSLSPVLPTWAQKNRLRPFGGRNFIAALSCSARRPARPSLAGRSRLVFSPLTHWTFLCFRLTSRKRARGDKDSLREFHVNGFSRTTIFLVKLETSAITNGGRK